ncbi:MAG: hypothetical protein KDC98_07065 [Planctomycetes bacterium]|nr:hypothetical protein [Planctomycetota bacterium]
MRLCPTVEGSPSPLITHRIGSGDCQSRQGTHFHRCHKCIYRGKPADWVSQDPAHLTVEVGSANGVKNGIAGTSRKSSPPSRPERPAKVLESES